MAEMSWLFACIFFFFLSRAFARALFGAIEPGSGELLGAAARVDHLKAEIDLVSAEASSGRRA